ncbi:probable calcium-binding protein CML44 [Coffea eugenioides]|uniref:probable calcium-binding protein CML44 n=1 Tax=Coffea eugenioides TaxID=49369 RepID=UPI000F614A96|nr:probable calcium-binding protein CML44 [Coffea eugenioides]
MSCLSANDLQRIFQKLDKNGAGLISIDQLKWLLEKIGFQTSIDDLQVLMGSGKCLDSIDFFFFYDIVIEKQKKGGDEASDDLNDGGDLVKAFKVFDLNDDGFISCEELQSVLSRLGLWDEQNCQDCKRMISMYDMNSDGLLDFEEFKFMMLSDFS